MTLDELLALLPDNNTGAITPADMRTIVTELYNAAHPPYQNVVNQGPANLVTHATWTPVPGTGPFNYIIADDNTVVQFILSLNADTLANGNQVQVGLDISGATVVPVGSKPEQVLWIGGKQQVQATLEVTFLQTLMAGTNIIAPEYTAQAAATLSAMAVIANVVSGGT
jgi:hypothetical protein